MARTLIGTVETDGKSLFIITTKEQWFALTGMGANACAFRNAFGSPQKCDVGKRVYSINGIWQMENAEQRDARLAIETE